jgi:hypothetical protein
MDSVLLLIIGAVAALVVERGWNWLSPRVAARLRRKKQAAYLESQRRQWRETTLAMYGDLMGRRYTYHAPNGEDLEVVVVDMGGMYYNQIHLEFVDQARASALGLGTRVTESPEALDPGYMAEYRREEAKREEAEKSERRFTPHDP